MPALIFDCDGVLADTERDGHRVAFNQMFAEFGLPVRWDDAEYSRRVLIGGGKERLASLLTPEFVAEAGLPADPNALAGQVAQWHRRKSEIYAEIVASGALPPRPGIHRIAAAAADRGDALAVASTSAEPSVRAVLERAVGAEIAARFRVFAGDIVPKKKPAPDIYLLALAELGVGPAGSLVVEDSANGVTAARDAGLRTVVTVSAYTAEEDFSDAALVVSCLGDPGGARTQVLAAAAGVWPGEYVTLADLDAVRRAPVTRKARREGDA
jgi:HAD superfamily hydrolase (TIGR01509 family)